MAFFTHFQLSIQYETGTHLLTSLKKYTVTHISNHIHGWKRRRRLIEFETVDELLTQWFKKSFVSKISKDITMGGCVIEEQAMARAQYLDLVYSKSGTLYEVLPDAPRPYLDLTASKSPDVPLVDGVISSMSQTSTKDYLKSKSISNTGSNNPSKNSSSPGKTSEVYDVQSTAVDKAFKGKKKGKGKAKSNAPRRS